MSWARLREEQALFPLRGKFKNTVDVAVKFAMDVAVKLTLPTFYVVLRDAAQILIGWAGHVHLPPIRQRTCCKDGYMLPSDGVLPPAGEGGSPHTGMASPGKLGSL